jgi:hypothetical protein
MNSEIIERDGKLFVLDPWQNHFSQPIEYRTAWPTGLFAKDWSDYVGKTVRPIGDGTYQLDNGLFLRLEHGGYTKPSHEYSEERRIPKPPMMKEYRSGRWCL